MQVDQQVWQMPRAKGVRMVCKVDAESKVLDWAPVQTR
jgi:hypothetical protein